ncbi:MAG: polyphosphate polymerase domain-containing protein [Lachnospiraceae bacterium]|nr:polyphosphate polymerase domain-containing protein [Lachnospiraceae bacterium]
MGLKNTFKRYEMKYLISQNKKREIENMMEEYIEPDKYFHSLIQNIYYDTPDYRLIRTSMEKPLYKEKLRLRSYGVAGKETPAFIEIKKKYDGIVYKRRVEMEYEKACRYLNLNLRIVDEKEQILREIDYFKEFYKDLKGTMYISYERDAYHGKENPDLRITFDNKILYRTDNLTLDINPYGTDILNKGECLMEIKIADAMPLWLTGILEQPYIKKTSFSKYGRAYENEMYKRNRLNERRA